MRVAISDVPRHRSGRRRCPPALTIRVRRPSCRCSTGTARAAARRTCVPAPPSRCSRRRRVTSTSWWPTPTAGSRSPPPSNSCRRVESYVKNAFLGFEFRMWTERRERRYQPDFLLRVKTPGDERFQPDRGDHRLPPRTRALVRAMQRWLPAVNAQREQLGLLPWHFAEVTEIERINSSSQTSNASPPGGRSRRRAPGAPSSCCWNS